MNKKLNWLFVKKLISESDVEKIEKEYKIQLPSDYKKMIGAINGGALKNASVHHRTLGSISYSRNVALNRDAALSVHDLIRILNDGQVRYFPFGSVENGDYFCFDLKEKNVVLYVHEGQKYLPVYDRFEELLGMIQEE